MTTQQQQQQQQQQQTLSYYHNVDATLRSASNNYTVQAMIGICGYVIQCGCISMKSVVQYLGEFTHNFVQSPEKLRLGHFITLNQRVQVLKGHSCYILKEGNLK